MTNQYNKAGWKEVLFWALGIRSRIVVRGVSMSPALRDGDELLMTSRKIASVGEIVVFPDPRDSDVIMLKRVKKLISDDEIWVEGDNPDHSTDSRSFGAIKRADLIGVVTSSLTKSS